MTDSKPYRAVVVLSVVMVVLFQLAVFTYAGILGVESPQRESYTILSAIIPAFLFFFGIAIMDKYSRTSGFEKQLRKSFTLRVLTRQIPNLTDFYYREGMFFLVFEIGLAISLGTWVLFGVSEGVDLSHRMMYTFLVFFFSIAGLCYLNSTPSIEYSKRKIQERRAMLKTLDLEAKGLTEYDFEDIQNIAKIQIISLGRNELKRLDLTPLTGSRKLTELILYYNRLEEIDLTPLAQCPNLEYLDLAINNLHRLDLTPLASCKKLNAINLGGNPTGQIDLTPLSTLSNLKILTIDDMKLQEVDLSPLENCKKLEFLKLDDNELISLDVTPLFECRSLIDFPIDRIELTTTLPQEIEDWPEGVRKNAKRFRKS